MAACLGAIAFLAILGSGTLFPWQASLIAVVLLIGMLGIIYTKLQFRYSVQLRSTSTFTANSVLEVVRTKFSDARVSEKRDGSAIEVKPTMDSSEIRIQLVRDGASRIDVVSPPPAMGELSSARLRKRMLEWADVVDALKEALGER